MKVVWDTKQQLQVGGWHHHHSHRVVPRTLLSGRLSHYPEFKLWEMKGVWGGNLPASPSRPLSSKVNDLQRSADMAVTKSLAQKLFRSELAADTSGVCVCWCGRRHCVSRHCWSMRLRLIQLTLCWLQVPKRRHLTASAPPHTWQSALLEGSEKEMRALSIGGEGHRL